MARGRFTCLPPLPELYCFMKREAPLLTPPSHDECIMLMAVLVPDRLATLFPFPPENIVPPDACILSVETTISLLGLFRFWKMTALLVVF